MSSSQPHTDITTTGWIARLPASWEPYLLLMRLDRPIGTWLLLLPSWWAILAASGTFSLQTLWLMGLFAAGSIIMRGAGCVINDLWDRDFDKQVERTRSRPLAAGTVTPKQAILFLSVLLLLGLLILLSLNLTTIILGICALIPVILYPLAKRITWYPQAVLGLTFNFGALMGASAVLDTIPLFSICLYAAGFFWTMGYDTIYATQDIADDTLIGVKSTARKFGKNVKTYCAIFYALTALLLGISTFLVTGFSGLSLLILPAIAHLIWQIKSWAPETPQSSLGVFRSNRDFGILVTLVFLTYLLT